MEDVLEMKATLDALKVASDVQAGREDEKKTQIDNRQKKEGRRDFWLTTAIALLGLFFVYSQYRSERARAHLIEQIDKINVVPAVSVAPSRVGP